MKILQCKLLRDHSPLIITYLIKILKQTIMKKTNILTLVFILLCNISFCQLEKKTWLVGGNGNFTNKNYSDNSKTNSITINGNIGYFLNDKFVVGLKPGFTHQSAKNVNSRVFSNLYQIGPFVRYYFLKKDAKLNLFSDISYQFGVVNSNNGFNGSINKFISNAGFVLFFNTDVALEFTLGYSTITNNTVFKTNDIQAGVGFQFHLTK